MITFKLGETDGGPSGVVSRSESSQTAINKLDELVLAPVKPPSAKAGELPASPVPEQAERFYSDCRRIERWNLLISSLPLSAALGLGYCLLFTNAPQWSAVAVMLTGFIIFGLAGYLIEQQMLKSFACPGCEAPIDDWDTDEKHRILVHCPHCGSRWDIEYKLAPEIEIHPARAKRHIRSDFYTVCSPRGAH